MVKSENPSQVQIEAAVATSVGMVREVNEDRYLLNPANRLFVVADGMGGHAAGEVASQLAIEKITGELAALQAETNAQPKEVLLQAINAVHRAIRTAAQNDPNLQGMGTTIVIAWFPTTLNTLWVAHIGDSRLYLLRSKELWQLTEDHTLLNQALKLKKNNFDIEFLPSKHLLSQALGASEFVAPGIQALEVLPGDLLLLCSDGLTDMLEDEDVRELLSKAENLDRLCQVMVDEANARGGRDNCTVMVLRIAG